MARRLTGTAAGHPVSSRSDVAAHRLAQIAAGVAGRPDPGAATSTTADDGGAAGVGGPVEPTDAAWWRDHTRVAARPQQSKQSEQSGWSGPPGLPAAPTAEPPAPVIAATAIPVPGRHAARRSGRGRRLPLPALPALPVVRAGHVTIVALAVAAALGLTTWWVLRDQPTSIAALSAEPASPLVAIEDSTGPTPSPEADGVVDEGATSTGSVTVDVAGKVRRPGIVVLPVGSRVTDALAAAGGARRGVDLTAINLARPLVDGEQVLVGMGALPGAGVSGGSPPGATAGGPGGLVNLNTADATTLEALPQVGPVTAAAIVAWRLEHGGFTSIDELLEVDGIGEATLEQIRPHATL